MRGVAERRRAEDSDGRHHLGCDFGLGSPSGLGLMVCLTFYQLWDFERLFSPSLPFPNCKMGILKKNTHNALTEVR